VPGPEATKGQRGREPVVKIRNCQRTKRGTVGCVQRGQQKLSNLNPRAAQEAMGGREQSTVGKTVPEKLTAKGSRT